MKKRLAALLLAGFLFWAQLPAFAEPMLSGAKTTLFSSSEDLSNATATVVAAVADKTIFLYKLNFIIDAADTVTLKCGSTVVGKWEFTGAGGLDEDIYPLAIPCASNEALTLTKGTAANDLYWQVWYEQEYDQ